MLDRSWLDRVDLSSRKKRDGRHPPLHFSALHGGSSVKQRSLGSHPDHVRTVGSKPAPAAAADPYQALPNPSPHRPADNALEALNSALAWFCGRTDGWLRMVPDRDSDAVWLKWKFTSARWPNHYVMVRAQSWQMPFAFLELKRKVVEVDQGERAPTLDRPYGSA